MSVEQIDLFFKYYNSKIHSATELNPKMHLFAEFLKHKKYYMQNNINDTLLLKNFGLSKSDMRELDSIIDKIREGTVEETNKNNSNKTNISGKDAESLYYNFNENEEDEPNGF